MADPAATGLDPGEVDLDFPWEQLSAAPPAPSSRPAAPEVEKAEVEGTIEHVLFHNDNEASPYCVARVRTKNDSVIVVGSFDRPKDGLEYHFVGQWVEHPTYGRQLSVHWLEETFPTSAAAIRKYLASGAFKGTGIGKKTAEKIVTAFGDDTFRVIEEEPGRLREIKGLSADKIHRIKAEIEKRRATRRVMTQLSAWDITPALAGKILRDLGPGCVEIVRRNPYILADRIRGVGFKIADGVARGMGLAADDSFRLRAGIRHALQQAEEDGHFYLPREELLKKAADLLGVEVSQLEPPLEKLGAAGKVVIEDEAVYDQFQYRREEDIARQVQERCQLEGREEPSAERIHEVQQALGDIELAALQVECLRKSLSSGIFIMTGGPGTGKTTTVRAILELCRTMGLHTVLAAPTGRASRRMKEATGQEARTIHRLLEYSPTENSFKRNKDRPLKADVIIVDEMSMVDAWLFQHLLDALDRDTHMVLVGDRDQLPSVGAGCVLRDLIDSNRVPVVFLNEIFRQGEGSQIVQNAHRINQGEMPVRGSGNSDYFFLPVEKPEDIAQTIIDLCARRLPGHYGFDPRDDIQVIAPMYRGAVGVTALNEALQARLNPQEGGAGTVPVSNGRAAVGDKVMQLRNNYDMGVFNGDMGIIGEVDEDEDTFTVRLLGGGAAEDPEEVVYDAADAGDLALAYACTIHKSQGSEFPVVVIPLSTSHYIMLQRNLLYTALTRARKLAVLVGSEKALRMAIKNDVVVKRYTRLAQRLQRLGQDEG